MQLVSDYLTADLRTSCFDVTSYTKVLNCCAVSLSRAVILACRDEYLMSMRYRYRDCYKLCTW